jgi:ABC-type transport system involved in multi-copper enzyme maturation permease subunit
MLWQIAQKEFLSNILTLRFLIGFILCQALIVSSEYVLIKDYEARLAAYSELTKRHEEAKKGIKVYSQLEIGVDRPPEPLSIMAMGFDKQLGNTLSVTFKEIPTSAFGSGAGNPLLSVFSAIDVVLIIQIIIGLLTFLFAYDTISGERERGTLALMLSNAVPRHQVLLGKYFGGMLSIVLSLACGLLFGLLVIAQSKSISLTAEIWARIGLICLVSLIYISTLFMLAMLVSSRCKRSTTSLIFILFLWVAFVVLLPNAGAYISRHIHKIKPKAVVDSQIYALENEFWNIVNEDALKNQNLRPRDLWRFQDGNIWTYHLHYPLVITYAPKENMLWYLAGTKFSVPLHFEYAEKKWEIYRQWEKSLIAQSEIAKTISRLSPSWIFYHASSILARTDSQNYVRFMEQVRRYRQEIIDYGQNNKGFSTLTYFDFGK